MTKGFLIALEGIDGAGKTTQAKLLVKWLESNGVKAIYTSEPTDSEIGRIIKKHLKAKRKYSEETIALLFAADRLYHVEKVITPAIDQGKVVVTDRYIHSSIAYQTVTTGRRTWIEHINSLAPKPDLSILIDTPVNQAIRRIQTRKKYLYEKQRFLAQVRKEYLRLVSKRQMIRIDGRGDKLAVNRRIIKIILREIDELKHQLRY